jgi:hypothetical protein
MEYGHVLRWLTAIPKPLREGVAGALLLGVPGAIAGLIIGINAYASTAGFAALEVGIPCVMAGFVLGIVVGSIAPAARHMRRERPR